MCMICFIHRISTPIPIATVAKTTLIFELTHISKNLVEYYCKCYILIGYATRYLFASRFFRRFSHINAQNVWKCCFLISFY